MERSVSEFHKNIKLFLFSEDTGGQEFFYNNWFLYITILCRLSELYQKGITYKSKNSVINQGLCFFSIRKRKKKKVIVLFLDSILKRKLQL